MNFLHTEPEPSNLKPSDEYFIPMDDAESGNELPHCICSNSHQRDHFMNIQPKRAFNPFSVLVILGLTLGFGVSPSQASDNGNIEYEAVHEMHEELASLKKDGFETEGDTSAQAIIEQYYSDTAQTDAVSPRRRSATNGCSTPKQIKKLVAKWNKVFKPACDKHDLCYSKFSKRDRRSCDDIFGRSMQKICTKMSIGERSQCKRMAAIYKSAVRLGGNKNYKGKGRNN